MLDTKASAQARLDYLRKLEPINGGPAFEVDLWDAYFAAYISDKESEGWDDPHWTFAGEDEDYLRISYEEFYQEGYGGLQFGLDGYLRRRIWHIANDAKVDLFVSEVDRQVANLQRTLTELIENATNQVISQIVQDCIVLPE